MRVFGKKVLITGAARRAGAALACSFAGEGAAVCLHCGRSVREGEELLSRLPGTGHRLLVCDLSVPGEAEKLFREAGKVEILINNASIYARESAVLEESAARRYFEVNFWSPLALMREFVRQDLPEGGAVVNILDQEVLRSVQENGPYSWSRKALMEATLSFARQFGAQGLRFNAVAPGPMLPPAGLENSKMEKILKTVPTGRKVELEEFVSAVKFLVGNDSATGTILPVDGGQHIF